MANEEVLQFIRGFAPAQTLFLNGYCYWFARILTERFAGWIMYEPVDNHFMACIGYEYYDASGMVTDQYPRARSWDRYKRFEKKHDPLHIWRLKNLCILKKEIDR